MTDGFPNVVRSGDPGPSHCAMTRDELIAALEAALGPDRKLDWGIHVLLRTAGIVPSGGYRIFIGEEDGSTPHYTGSRDAMLPGAENYDWRISGMRTRPNVIANERWTATAKPDAPAAPCSGSAATEPLARRIAEIKALVPVQ